jgi:hypothetical protein
MCDRCVELDRKIDHYHRLASRFIDQALLDGIRGLIEWAEVEKAGTTRIKRSKGRTGLFLFSICSGTPSPRPAWSCGGQTLAGALALIMFIFAHFSRNECLAPA